VEPAGLLRAFAWGRLAIAVALLVTVPLTASEFAPVAGGAILPLALGVTVASSAAVLLRRVTLRPQRIAALLTALDVVLVTAVVTSTGGPRSMFAFLYVLAVTAACVLLSRTGAVLVATSASALYAGLVLVRTLVPITYFFETPDETSVLEITTMFLNAATLLVIAVVAGGVAERYRTTHRALESRERDLRDLEAFRDLVFDCVGTGLVVLDPDHRVTAFNHAAADITGRGAALAGARWSDVVGEPVDVEGVAATLRDPAATSVRCPGTVQRPGGERVPVQMTFSTLRSAAGASLGLVVACEDVSALRRMEAELRQADRLASLGRMSANIAHEIRNPLASITGAVEALRHDGGFNPEERGRLHAIVLRESERLNGIIEDFLAYARPTPTTPRRTDVAALLEEVLLLLEHRPLPDGVKIVRAFEAPVYADVDPGALRQAVWNLCLNAVEAMPGGGELTIEAAPREAVLELRVADTGHGIAGPDLGHLFEPFFSTRPEGTGLGLALVHRVVRDHGGQVDVESEPGVGTTFTLTLPVTAHA
jgi:two-component system sensor histidine kinase PilS (NtrC family)